MKTKLNFLILGVVISFGLLITSCEEQPPPGLDQTNSKVADSSYLAPLEPKQDRMVVVEELTGVGCANCPKAARTLKTISEANDNRVLVAGIHPPSGGGFTEPLFGDSKYDFRLPEGDEIVNILGGIGPMPSASINRVSIGSGLIFDTDLGTWVNRITPMLAESTPVNISLSSTYNADNNNGELVAKITFTEDVTEDIFITAYILENDIEDYQKDGSDKILYNHQHVFRDAITSISGSSLNFTDKTAGTVIQKRIGFSPVIEGDNSWNVDNCEIIAFVHRSGDDKSVLHAQKIKLK